MSTLDSSFKKIDGDVLFATVWNDVMDKINEIIQHLNSNQINESTVLNWGFTKNGVTSIKLNGQTYTPVNGLVDLGTITSGSTPDLSAYLTKVEAGNTYQLKGNYLTEDALSSVVKSIRLNGSTYNPSNGVVDLGVITSSTTPDLSEYIKASVYTTSASGSVSLDANNYSLAVVTCTGNITSVSLSALPKKGHEFHVIFYSDSARTVTINHNDTSCVLPEGSGSLILDVPAKGYAELNFIYDGVRTYVRGA